MAADPVTGFDPDTDDQLKQDNAAMDAAGDQHTASQAQDAFAKAAPAAAAPETNGLQHWFTNLPQNVTSGLVTAAINSADAMHSGWKYLNEKADEGHKALYGNTNDEAYAAAHPDEPKGDAIQTPEYDEVRGAIQNFTSKHISVENPTLSDDITQGVAQFGIPFLGWSKAVSTIGGIGKLAAVGRTVFAEGATAATTQGAHDGRFADLISLGKHTEGKFADALNSITPDGSLLNGYINYMTNRDGEGEFEGRLKNVVDTVTGSAVISPILTAGAKILKGGMDGLRYSLENGVGSIDQLAVPNQEGKIGYHGTPHDFDTTAGFDNSKIGSGEGAQVYGYGHYLAESPDVAKGYQGRLSQMNIDPTSPLGTAKRIMDSDPSMTPAKVVQELNRRAAASDDPNFRSNMLRAVSQVKNGALDKAKGSLITADVADSHVDSMLDWDKKLSDQTLPKPVLDKIEDLKSDGGSIAHTLADPDATGADLHMVLQHTMGPTGAAKWLDANGVPGIKYLDGNSRGTGAGTRNLVVFDGKKIAVTDKNGKPVGITAAPKQDMSLSPEQRALERERVAAQRQREDGIMPEHVPEIIPHNAAAAEGEAARRDARP